MLNQALAIANGKGGVGKTSLAANPAAMASAWFNTVDSFPEAVPSRSAVSATRMVRPGGAASRSFPLGERLPEHPGDEVVEVDAVVDLGEAAVDPQ